MVPLTANVLGNPLTWISIAAAIVATIILLWFLVSKPPIDLRTKLLLFFGIFAFPITSAMTGNVVGFETTMDRDFCASCHVMEPWTDDSMDPTSQTLAARHSRNKWFGAKNCYTCHSDYEMFGMVTTKLTGMLHVYHYYLSYLDVSQEEAKKKIELYAPFKNLACMQCHSTEAKIWNEQIDHKGARDDVRTEKVSCVSRGCHGPAHPFSKLARGEVLDAPPSGGPIERVETATPTGEVSP